MMLVMQYRHRAFPASLKDNQRGHHCLKGIHLQRRVTSLKQNDNIIFCLAFENGVDVALESNFCWLLAVQSKDATPS